MLFLQNVVVCCCLFSFFVLFCAIAVCGSVAGVGTETWGFHCLLVFCPLLGDVAVLLFIWLIWCCYVVSSLYFNLFAEDRVVVRSFVNEELIHQIFFIRMANLIQILNAIKKLRSRDLTCLI